MAQAPAPGSVKKAEQAAASQRVLRVRLRDDTFKVASGNVPIRVKDRFMRETGRALEWYLHPDRVASADVALCGLWFLSRLLDGENVTWAQTLDEWDAAGFVNEDIEVIEEEPSGDDPEV